MKIKLLKLSAAMVLTASLTGCIGQMATSGMLMQGNLKMVDNRYARAGLYMLLSPIYGIAATADLFVFNTIEFWTGTNPLTGKKAVADAPSSAVIKINDKLDKSLKSAPVNISAANVKQIDSETLEMSIAYADGSAKVLRGQKEGDNVNFFLDGQYLTTASINEMQEYAQKRI
ncbi:MAG: DUF3332 domain-containing protein [Enterovibrio sp.]